MTKKILYSFTFLSIITIVLSFYYLKPKESNSIIVQFVTINGYGNNLYIDNVTFGSRPNKDIAVTSINNIPRDTTYLNDVYTYKITPQINITNLSYNSTSDTIFAVLVVNSNPIYKKIDSSLLAGATKTITFDTTIDIYAGQAYNIIAFVKKIQGDTAQSNDTLKQTSVFLYGAARNVLVEEFTSNTSPSCASNNPSLNSYIDSNIQNICAVKYHLGFPISSSGVDSMYLADSIQQNQRANYYYVYSVPSTFLDGKLRVPLPYSTDSNLSVPFNERFSYGSPITISVSDSILTDDTIQATINIELLYTLGANNLRLRICAIERKKLYSTAPGTNGETDFYDIFKQAYPDSAGIKISNAQGQSQFIYKYHCDSTWSDSFIYTLAFVQNDDTKEVLNCGKSRQTVKFYKSDRIVKSDKICYKADLKNNIPVIYKKNIVTSKDTITNNFNFEGFEGQFPPIGWSILNPDVGFTFEQLSGYNGPTLGGIHCIKVPFYDYPNTGQKDTLLSVKFEGVTELDTFRFDYSYAQFLSGYLDSLVVSMSTDEGMTFTPVFQEGGFSLSTTQATTLSYAPTSTTQWYTYYYPMSDILPFSPVKPIPGTYKLYQNYPNPFNPKTNIKFDLPHNVLVVIKIYDILGREITTLLNDKMSAGSHTVEFTASNLASGIYFYRIIAGDFIEVKKMALIK